MTTIEIVVITNDDGTEVGRCEIKYFNKRFAEIAKLSVIESYRGKGYGSRLLKKAVENCAVPLMIATVRFDNEFWWRENIKQGFKLVDRIYRDTGDLLVFLRNKSASYPR